MLCSSIFLNCNMFKNLNYFVGKNPREIHRNIRVKSTQPFNDHFEKWCCICCIALLQHKKTLVHWIIDRNTSIPSQSTYRDKQNSRVSCRHCFYLAEAISVCTKTPSWFYGYDFFTIAFTSPPYALGDIGFFNDPSHGSLWLIEKACPWPPSINVFFCYCHNISATFLGWLFSWHWRGNGDWLSIAKDKLLDGWHACNSFALISWWQNKMD